MPISDKFRKILWARSGNRCAYCKRPLILSGTSADTESVIGEECHIVSSAPTGPRYDPLFPSAAIDTNDNLILLCAADHKRIDDQNHHHTAVVVRTLKQNHETWVESRFHDGPRFPKIRRIRKNIPNHLPRLTLAKELFALASDSSAIQFDHDDGLSNDEVEMVGEFIQDISDWVSLSLSLEPVERIRAVKNIQDSIDLLHESDFVIFAGVEMQQMENEDRSATSFQIFHLYVLRASSPRINHKPVNSSSEG